MHDTIQIQTELHAAAASVAGRDHLRAGKNNQDAFALWRGRGCVCAVVADGCGSAPHSEVGAQLGVRLCLHALTRRLASAPDPLERLDGAAVLMEEVRLELLESLRPIARGLAGSEDPSLFAAAVRDHLLFTLVGALVGPFGVVTFSIGDGALALDGTSIPLGPFAGNEPPYLAYALLPERAHGIPLDALRFSVRAQCAPPRTLALGTDGALDLFAALPPDALLGDARLFENPDALRRKLWLLAQGKSANGTVLRDDTTLILLRSSAAAGEA